ncbi:signal transduction histidine kinase [Leucobacter exalbidus]|uniref:histidine kinase n=1 Tax=Leucobacter exalbidus TaxID=662960 RepID=A0A940PV57_9MICO|nr:signal transduction histidine kinase [Leucobacter exalbidus]
MTKVPRATPGRPIYSPKQVAKDYAYVAPGFIISLIAFTVLLPLTALAFGTLVVWVGALLLPCALLLASLLARISRARLHWWGAELAPVQYAPQRPGITGLLGLMTEPRRWLDLVFEALIAFPLRLFTFVVMATWTAGALGGISYPLWVGYVPRDELTAVVSKWLTFGALPDEVAHSLALDIGANVVSGVIFLVTIPLVMRGLARLDAAVTAAALGGAPATSGAAASPAALPAGANPATLPAAPGAIPASNISRSGWTLIVTSTIALISVAINWPLLASLYGVPVVIAILLALAGAAALVTVPRWPVIGIALHTVATLVVAVLCAHVASAPAPWPVMMLIVQALLVLLVALRRPWPWALAAWVIPQVGVLLATVLLALPQGMGSASRANIIVSASVSLAAGVLGAVLRQLVTSRGALRAERLAAEGLTEQRRQLDERTRIAQELHDVVAHSMSVISVQAMTVKYRLPEMPADAEHEFHTIEQSSRQALSEMRGLLGLLRSPEDRETLQLAPQPTLTDIPALVAATRHSGAQISLRMPEAAAALETVPAATGLTAFRTVQEALSNAVRHAPRSPIEVTVQLAAGRASGHGEVMVEVMNGAAAGASPVSSPGAGLGLAGLTERVQAVGGAVMHGATDAGGFFVRAELPA